MEDSLPMAIRAWNPWWSKAWVFPEAWVPRAMLRDLIAVLDTRHVKDIIGVRRCGKTTLVFQVIRHLIEDSIPPERIVFLNFADLVIRGVDFTALMNAVYVVAPDVECLFLDEVQEKPGWERLVLKFHETGRFRHVFVTGSNASLLSDDVGRLLTGRHLSFVLFPFSFKEFLLARGWEKFDTATIKKEVSRLNGILETYLLRGGFPEARDTDPLVRRQVLTNLFGDIIARDIASRHVVDVEKINALAQYAMTNFTREFSLRRVASALRIHVDTVDKYLQYLEQSFMIFKLPLFSYKQLRQFHQNKKFYAIDNGLRDHVAFKTTGDMGRMAENVVFLALKRRGAEIYYWKDGNHEVDFLVTKGAAVQMLIQVSWDISSNKTRTREISGIVAAAKTLKVSGGILLNRDVEGVEMHEGIKVELIPISTWLILS